MSPILDITDFVYNTGTLTIAPGDTTAVFSGTSLSASIKDGDTLCAGGVKVPIKTVTDDTHAELFTAWDGASVTGGAYVILKDSMLRNNAVQIGYDTAAFLSFLDNTTIWYVVEDAAPDPSVGEDSNRALKTNVTPWQQWLKTGGVWVEQAGSPGGPGATILVQDAEPDTSHPDNSLWIDSDSTDLDVYALTGSPPAWTDTGMNLKGAPGPSPWTAPAAWVTGTAYVAAPPASAVTQGGETYVCLIAHTSGSFSTDLAAGKWIKVAAKGADGTGVGDMVKATYDPTNVAGDVFNQDNMVDGTTNKNFTATEKTKLSGLNAANYATAAQGTKADSAVQSIVPGTGIAVDSTDPHNPIVSVSSARQTLPTIQRFISGSGTYTTPANVLWIEVTLVGGGAGGAGGNNSSSATYGGDTTFGSYTAGRGAPGIGIVGGAGGTVTGSPNVLSVAGGYGNDATQSASGATVAVGGLGGSSSLGGAGKGSASTANGLPAATNSGSGGGGGGVNAAANLISGGGGGGSGATIKAIINSPAATYSYAVGGGGAGAAAGANGGAGGAGAAGIIIVIEHYGS